MKKFLLSLLLVTPLMANAQKVWEGDDYTVTKISNPDHGEREIDGLIAGGDRQNSYTWRLAARGDEIYIATARNIASALVNMYGSQISAASGMSMDTFWALIDVFANGDIMRNNVNEGANIISYNRKTGEFKVLWTGGPGEYQRMAVTFGDNVYFGSYSADQSIEQYILKLDPEGNFTKVYTTTGTTAMRANCVYDDHLFFASSDARTVVAEGDAEPLAKMAVIRKSNEDDTVWDLVADYKDFGTIPYDPIQSSWAGAPFWELASHNGYIYATAPSTAGFVIFKGRPAEDGESANEYGWHWEEVAGLNNGINNPGLSDVPGGEPGTMRSLIGSVYEFNGELYAYNFDHAFGGIAQGFVGMLQQLKSGEVKASDYLSYLYNTLHNPQKVWKLNDETGKFEELTAFTELMEGTLNEYVWRMGEHNGKLYVATMDAGIGYGYLTQLTNGSFLKMSPAERAEKIGYVNAVIKLLALEKGNEKADELRTKLELLKTLLEQYTETTQVDEKTIQIVIDIQGLTQEIVKLIVEYKQQQNGKQTANLSALVVKALETLKTINLLDQILITTLLDQVSSGAIREQWNAFVDAVAQGKHEELREHFTSQLKGALDILFIVLQSKIADIHDRIDVKGLEMYAYINKAVMKNEWGFDLLRTSDGGKSFEVITRTGFDDKYNYGCPSFLSTEEGLYFGTCNPFYGGQLYLLSEDGEKTPSDIATHIPGDTPTDIVGMKDGAQKKAYNEWYDLQGRRIKSASALQKGFYLHQNKKIYVK